MTTIGVVVPTFNEPDLVRRCVDSLEAEASATGVELTTYVVNAGKPLPADLAARVIEIPVPSDHFWTRSVKVGFERLREVRPEYTLLMNADTTFLPGSLARLMAVAKEPNTVACSPGYMRDSEGKPILLYAHESFNEFLWHGRPVVPWKRPEEAPDELRQIRTCGGQGVLFRTEFLDRFDVDPDNFPQAKGDHDFWFTCQEGGLKLVLVMRSGAVNDRGFGPMSWTPKQRFRKLWWRASHPQSSDSWPNMWRLRKKHQGMPKALISFALMFPRRFVRGFFDVFAPTVK